MFLYENSHVDRIIKLIIFMVALAASSGVGFVTRPWLKTTTPVNNISCVALVQR